MSRDIYLEVGGVKSLWLISKEFREYCKEEYPEIKDENYFDGDDDCWVDGFISYLEKKYWNKTFHYEYENKTDSFLIYEVEIPDYKLKQKGGSVDE